MLFLRYDGVIVYEGENITNEAKIAVFTGHSIPYDLWSNGTTLTVRFISDHAVRRPGFNISYASGRFVYVFVLEIIFRDKMN